MAENKNEDNENELSEESNLETDGAIQDAPSSSADAEGDGDDDESPSPYEEASMPLYTEHDPHIRNLNRQQFGMVTIHYPARDVKVPMDGDAAIRLLSMFRARSNKRWQDFLDPRWSLAINGWLVLDLTEPLAMSYMPVMEPDERTVIDPAVAA